MLCLLKMTKSLPLTSNSAVDTGPKQELQTISAVTLPRHRQRLLTYWRRFDSLWYLQRFTTNYSALFLNGGTLETSFVSTSSELGFLVATGSASAAVALVSRWRSGRTSKLLVSLFFPFCIHLFFSSSCFPQRRLRTRVHIASLYLNLGTDCEQDWSDFSF